MSLVLRLAAASAWNRRFTVALTVLAVALSVALLVTIERVRHDARRSFTHSISGTDLVVGPRSSPVQLMLYSVFRIGDAPGAMSWSSYRALSERPGIAWTIPLSLGDNHRGFPVVGTDASYFRHFRYGREQALVVRDGRLFEGLFEAVIGAEAARRLAYRVGDAITLDHGLIAPGHDGDGHRETDMPGARPGSHGDKPFRVVGILQATGTPVDRSIHIGLESMEAIHLEWQGGAPLPGLNIPAEWVRKFDLNPKRISAALVGLHSRGAVFGVQRGIDAYRDEALMAVMPGVALDELWRIVGTVEKTLSALSLLVVGVGFCGMVAVLLASLSERRREMAVYRSVGARPSYIFGLLLLESGLIAALAASVGHALAIVLLQAAAPYLQTHFALLIEAQWLLPGDARLLLGVLLGGLVAGLVPGIRAYRLALSDGLSPRV